MDTVVLPANLNALWQHLAQDPTARFYAGGTDLLVRRRKGLIPEGTLICLERIEALKRIEDRDREVFVGAAATHSRILEDPLIRAHFPILIQALERLGSPPIRRMGTIGGNIVTASPAGDTLPPLYALDAEVELRTAHSGRRLLVKDFIQGPGLTLLAPGEIVTGVRLKKCPENNLHHFEKVGQRKALAIAVVSLAAILAIDENKIVRKARLAWGSVGPTVVVSREIEQTLEGHPLSLEILEKAAALARRVVSPIEDIRAGADYRRQVAGNLLLRLGVCGG